MEKFALFTEHSKKVELKLLHPKISISGGGSFASSHTASIFQKEAQGLFCVLVCFVFCSFFSLAVRPMSISHTQPVTGRDDLGLSIAYLVFL